MDLRTELTAELRKARGWLLAVGLIMFVMDLVAIYVVSGDFLPPDTKMKLSLLSLGVLAGFAALAWFTPKKPKLCLIGGLVLFWGIILFNAFLDPSSLYKGIVLKVLFTLALVKGLKSASRAEVIMDDIGDVFD